MGYEAWCELSPNTRAELDRLRWRGYKVALACAVVACLLLLPKLFAAMLIFYGVPTAMPPAEIAYGGYAVALIGLIVFLLHIRE